MCCTIALAWRTPPIQVLSYYILWLVSLLITLLLTFALLKFSKKIEVLCYSFNRKLYKLVSVFQNIFEKQKCLVHGQTLTFEDFLLWDLF